MTTQRDQEKIVAALQDVKLFQSLNTRQIKSLATRFAELKYEVNDVIVSQGRVGIGLFIVESGSVEVLRERLDGSKVFIEKLGANAFFGELSLLDEEPRTASVIALEPTMCLAITRLDFLEVLREDVEIPILMLTEMARRLRLALETR
jgi:CRP/FNR family transcriptional regulator, cyclic AMP receptor protein